MKCEEYVKLMSEYLDRDMDSRARESWEQHFRDCEPCRRFFQSFKNSLELINYLKVQECPPEVSRRLEGLVVQKALQRQLTL